MPKKWVKLWCNDDNDSLTLEESGFWYHVLKLAGSSPVEGVVCVTPKIAYQVGQLSQIMGCSGYKIKRFISRFEELGRIVVLQNKTLELTNWGKYQSEYSRTKPYYEASKNSTSESTHQNKKENKNTTKSSIYIDILNYWNSFEIIHHKTLNDSIKGAIKSALKENTEYEICGAIKTYAEIIHSDDYFFSYTWTLKDFLKRGLDKFLDGDVARKNFAQREEKNGTETDLEKHRRRGDEYMADIIIFHFVCDDCGYETEKRYRKHDPRKPKEQHMEACPKCGQVEFHWDGEEGT